MKHHLARVLAVAAVLLYGCGSAPPPESVEPEHTCPVQERLTSRARTPELSKLEPSLMHALSLWRDGVTYASCDRLTVIVDFTGDVDALSAAGLETGHRWDHYVTGSIAFHDLETLVVVPGAISVAMQPHFHIR